MVSASRSIIYLLLVGMMAQVNCVAVYCGLFSMNRKAIAETVCEKKIEDCSGGCFLNKQIASTQDQDENAPASGEKRTPDKSPEELLNLMQAIEPAQHHPKLLPSMGSRFAAAISNLPTKGHLRPVFQPPDTLLHMAIG